MKKYLLVVAVFGVTGSMGCWAFAGHPGYGWQEGPTFGIQTPSLPPPNPLVQDSGRYVAGVWRGPVGVRHHVATNREQVYASAYDPNRGYVDPGSMQYVDGWRSDGRGGTYRQSGYAWTSNGVPHEDMNATRRYRTSFRGTRSDNTHWQKDVDEADRE